MKIFVISIKGSPRRKELELWLDKTLFTYVDGVVLDENAYSVLKQDSNVAEFLQKGDLGCTVAHTKAYKQAVNELADNECCLILEDDVKLIDGLILKDVIISIKNITKIIPSHPYAVALHRNTFPDKYGGQAILYNKAAVKSLVTYDKLFLDHFDRLLHRNKTPIEFLHLPKFFEHKEIISKESSERIKANLYDEP